MRAAHPDKFATDSSTIIVPASEYDLTAPQTFQEISSNVTLADSYRSNDVVLGTTYGAQVWFMGHQGIVLNVSGKPVYQYGDVQISQAKTSDPTHLKGTSLLLGAAGAQNYYHWTYDILPKFKVLEMAGISLDSIDHFILRDTDWGFQRAMLEIIGIAKEKIHIAKIAPRISCDKLHHIEIKNFVGMRMHRFIPDYLTDLFLKNKENIQTGRKLFIARPKDEKRSVENEQELRDLVTSHGYEVVTVRGLSFYEQAALFYSADSIITSHGAVLANLSYCRPRTQIIELFGSHVFSYFYGLSNLCKLQYTAILCSADQYDLVIDPFVGNSRTDKQITIKQSSELNLTALKEALNTMCNRHNMRSTAA